LSTGIDLLEKSEGQGNLLKDIAFPLIPAFSLEEKESTFPVAGTEWPSFSGLRVVRHVLAEEKAETMKS